MHKQIWNEIRLAFVIEPRGPLLIKSGQEAGADPTLLDMNFVRLDHAALGAPTVYLPGSSLKGTIRSYCEKIARTVRVHCCNPFSQDDSCDRLIEKEKKRRKTEGLPSLTTAEIYRSLCTVCKVFGHTVMASHVHFSDAYPLDPACRDDRSFFEAANATEQRDGVAIDRISGAVAAGPFSLEVVTKGAFFTDLVLRNAQLWQVGLLAIALRDLAQGRVPLGFAKSRGLGRVGVHYRELEVSYLGHFRLDEDDHNFSRYLYGVTEFLDPKMISSYDYVVESPLPLPQGGEITESGEYGRVTVVFRQTQDIEQVLRSCAGFWQAFVAQRSKYRV